MAVAIRYPNIIIGFSKAKSPWKAFSNLIREGEKRPFSHVYIKYKDSLTDLSVISQASHGMVNEMLEEIFLNDNVIIKEYEIELTSQQFIDIITFIRKNLGKPYSIFELALIAVKKLFKVQLNQFNDGDNSFICSELGARVCQIAGIITPEADFVTPSDLDALLEGLYGQITPNK